MENNIYYVYLHIKETDGTPFYVGKGKGNRSSLTYGRSTYWKNIVNKYGYDIIIIEDNLSNDKALELEKYWIKRIGRRDLDKGTLVNLTDGGETNQNISPISRKKISDSKLGNDYTKGFKHSEESIELRAKQLRGRPRDKNTRNTLSNKQRLYCQNNTPQRSKLILNLETGIYYDSAKEASKTTNYKYKSFHYRLKRNLTKFIYV